MQPLVALLHAALYVNRYANDPASMGIFVLIIVIGIAGYIVQARLQSVFAKYSEVRFPGGLTGAEVAEKMLRDNNIHNVRVTHVKGHLTDHFDPRNMTVNLSESVYSSDSVAAYSSCVPTWRPPPLRPTNAATPSSTPATTPRCGCARSWFPW